MQSAAHTVIQAKNMHQFRSKVYLGIAVLNIVGTLLLVSKYGVIGAAIPTGGAYLIGHGFIMNWYYWKKVNLDIPRFWRKILPIFSVAAVMSVTTLIISRWIDFYNWRNLIIGIVCYTIIYVICICRFVLNKYEKEMFAKRLFRKL